MFAIIGIIILITGIVCAVFFGKTKTYERYGETRTEQLTPPKVWSLIPIILGVVLIFSSCIYTQSVGEVVVLRNWGGQLAGHDSEAGFGLKAPWQEITRYDIRNNILSFMGETEEEQFEGGSANGSGIIVNDRGGARAVVDVQVNYSLDPEAAEDLYVNYGTQENFVKAICAVDIRAVPRQVAGQFDTITILTAREEFVKAIWEALETKWKPYGLVIEQVNVQHVEYPDNINESYTKAQQAEIDKQTAENKKSVAEVEAQTKVVQAQGEADANKILNDSLSDKVIQQHYIDALCEIGAHDNLIITDGSSDSLINVGK
jgi:regulator of protease activity HflC (stomatin/prohibitin superfamily)